MKAKTVLLQLLPDDRTTDLLLTGCGLDEQTIADNFERMNVYNQPMRSSLMVSTAPLLKKLKGRNVIALGLWVWQAMNLPKPAAFSPVDHEGTTWTLVPRLTDQAQANKTVIRKQINKLLKSNVAH